MNGHLSETMLNSLVDDEIAPAQAAEIETHLHECAACTAKALSQMMLKRATAQAGRRYEQPARMLKRLPLQGVNTTPDPQRAQLGWAGAFAAALILAVGIGFMQRPSTAKSEEAALVTEVTDQHLSGMTANQPPEVLSSDRHTVKPWFQGKIPFSFNLPDGLPSDTTLDGANLVYQGHRPVAQLLYSIGKHRVSVFVREAESANRGDKVFAAERSGFHVAALRSGELYIVAVSDVELARLDALATAIQNAQSHDRQR